MTKLIIVDLHALKKRLELNGSWFMAAQVEKQIQRQMADLCYFCKKPIHADSLKDHPECLSKLYDLVFEKKKAA